MNAKNLVTAFIEDVNAALRGDNANPWQFLHQDVRVWVNGTTPLSGCDPGLDSAAVILMGRGEGARGATYNNIYFFFVEVRDGKLFSVIESCDGSLVWRSAFDRHLAERPAG